jgi:hypothetical protein
VGALNPARLLVLTAVVFAFPNVAVGAGRDSRPSAAKRAALAAARAGLLHRADLHGWGETAATKKVPELACSAISPNLSGIKLLASADSPTFSDGSSGPFASNTAYVYGSVAQERSFWHRVVGRGLLACVADSLTAGSTSSVTFSVERKYMFSLPRIGARDAGYRARGTVASAYGSSTVYLDMIVVGEGSELAAISYTSFFDPPSRSLELRLARLVAGRLTSS